MNELNIAEIPFESGDVEFRYSRYLSVDGSKWIRHGLFRQYDEHGNVLAEGNYIDGLESGVWSYFHSNGLLAAKGNYSNGKEDGIWQYFSEQGNEENQILYANGQEVA